MLHVGFKEVYRLSRKYGSIMVYIEDLVWKIVRLETVWCNVYFGVYGLV